MMTEETRGTDCAGRRSKRFLTPLQKYEIFLQLLRQEVTVIEAAEQWAGDRSVIMRIRTEPEELFALLAGRARTLAGVDLGLCHPSAHR